MFRSGTRFLGALAMLATCLSGEQTQPGAAFVATAEAKITYSLAGARMPLWAGGAFVELENSATGAPNLVVYDKLGRMVANVAPSVPGASSIDVVDYARGVDGTMAVCANAFGIGERPLRYFVCISPGGLRQRAIRPGAYYPSRVTVAPDGTLWTLGFEMIDGPDGKRAMDPDAKVLRHFDPSGTELGAFIPYSSVRDATDISYGFLVVSADRVGWYSFRGGDKGAYVEVSNAGAVSRYPMPRPNAGLDPRSTAGVAITSSNRVFAAIGQRRGAGLYTLDRASGTWTPLDQPETVAGAKGVRLIGAEGDDLAFLFPNNDSGSQTQTVKFYRPTR